MKMENYIYKHGLPGIGVTGQQGKQGKSGNSIYFGTLESFFTYLDTSTLKNSSIDYDDKEYDITYAKDELRLNTKYNVGDLLYIRHKDSVDSSIDYIIEVTDELTTCTSTQLLEHISYTHPFMVDENKHHKLNIVDSGSTQELKNGMFVANELYNDYPVTITRITDINKNKPSVMNINNDNEDIVVIDENSEIPIKCNIKNDTTYTYLNNGKDIHKYTHNIAGNKELLSLKTSGNSLDVISNGTNYIGFKTNQKLYIDNLYIKTDNIGNIEASNVLYNKDLKLNEHGNCYTLTEDNYDSSTLSFIMNVDDFFNNIDVSKENYVYGYTHMYWNYNDMNNLDSSVHYQYGPNYIRGTFVDENPSTLKMPSLDLTGNYIRNYDNLYYKEIEDTNIKQLLINTYDYQTLNDVSNKLLNTSVNKDLLNQYCINTSIKGIIITEDVEQYLTYDKVQLPETKFYYKKYHTANNDIIVYNYNNSPVDKTKEENKFSNLFDTSFYSGNEYKQYNYNDSSVMTISLDKSDLNSQKYRHHLIYQFVGDKSGIKYFSNVTRADFNYQTSEFDINSSFVNANAVNKTRTYDYTDIFNINIEDNNMYVELKDKLTYVCNFSVYENDTLINDTKITLNNDTSIYKITGIITSKQDITTDVINKISDNKFLTDLYNSSVIEIPINQVLYTFKYNTIDDETADLSESQKNVVYSNIVTYNRIISGYQEKRTIPDIKLHIYNDLETLERLNNSDNGILCNQFQTFTSIQIDNFNDDNWGFYKKYYTNLKIRLYLNHNFIDSKDGSSTISEANETEYKWTKDKISFTLIKPGIDIFNISAKDLLDKNNIKEIINDYYEFTIDEANSGIWYLRFYMESENPEPYSFTLQEYIDKIEIVSDEHILPLENTNVNKSHLFTSNILKCSIAPISYIASYAQQSTLSNRILQQDLRLRKWFGNSDITNIAILPYKYDEISQRKTINRTKENIGRIPNWNSISFKCRYLQDNIQKMSIFTQNINNIYNLIPDKLYSKEWLCEDKDDISENYLRFIYNSNILLPRLINDQYSIIFNNKRLLASQYSQLSNNSAIYVHQYNDIQLRSEQLLKSMMKWNDIYEHDYHYDTDNPFNGHFETYGNGYQYLPKTADNSQYSTLNNILSLNEIKTQNELQFFDLGKNKVKTYNVNKPDKTDSYTPSLLFRSLLYQLSWCYPYYTTNNGKEKDNINNTKYPVQNKQYIKQLDFDFASVINGKNNVDKMPYNLCYNIYPRMMFNDEEQYNVVLMLRRPSIVKEGQYKLTPKDIGFYSNSNDLSNIQLNSINKYLYPLN